jgi:WhiB family redox-sensing transcriptional regulator
MRETTVKASTGIGNPFDFAIVGQPWVDQALCAQTDPESFFPEKGGSTREAKRVCLTCDVRAECLEYALDYDERFGIWGGLSERERRKLHKARDIVPIDTTHLVESTFLFSDTFTFGETA